MSSILHYIDTITEWLGRIFSWLLLAIVILISAEVVMRYIFNHPIRGAWDINVMLQGVIVVFGGAYLFLHGGHVRVDILVNKLSLRKRALLDTFLGILVIFAIGLLLWKVGAYAWWSVKTQEHYTSYWNPPLYPFKMVMTIAISVTFLQAITCWIRNLGILISREKLGNGNRS